MRHYVLRARLAKTPSVSWRWQRVEDDHGLAWHLVTDDGLDTGLRLDTREQTQWAVWVETASPLAIGDQVSIDGWANEAARLLQKAAFTSELLLRRAYRHHERHHYYDLREVHRIIEQAIFCLTSPSIDGVDEVDRIGRDGGLVPPPTDE